MTENAVILQFSANNPSQTDIFSLDDQLLYRVSTKQDGAAKTVDTTIRRAAGDVIAVLHWRSLLPDKLEGTIDEIYTPQINHCKFLRSLKPSTFEVSGKTYEWVNKGANEASVLVDLERGRPIVLFKGSKRDILTFQLDPPQLWCEFGALDMLDTIVITFLVLWKNQRTKASLGI